MPENRRVYVDESGVNTCLQREYARAPRGEHVEDTVAGNLFERVNVIGALWNGSHCAVECYRQATNK
ncbi:MAG: transposase, partial [Treponema sp.]|nr:transposase [Treponema sp.]